MQLYIPLTSQQNFVTCRKEIDPKSGLQDRTFFQVTVIYQVIVSMVDTTFDALDVSLHIGLSIKYHRGANNRYKSIARCIVTPRHCNHVGNRTWSWAWLSLRNKIVLVKLSSGLLHEHDLWVVLKHSTTSQHIHTVFTCNTI